MGVLRLADISPVRAQPVFGTNDIDAIREQISRVFKPHRAQPLIGGPIAARHAAATLGPVAFVHLEYGSEVAIDAGCMDQHLIVQMPLTGHSPIEVGGQRIVSTPLLGSVVNPHLPMRLSYSADCAQLIVRLDTARVRRYCADLLGDGLDRPLEFALGMRLDDQQGERWLQLVRFAAAEALQPRSLLGPSMETALIGMLLSTQPHNYSEALLAPRSPAAPWYVRRAEDYMAAHADRPISLADLAREAGISARALQEGFRAFRDTTPKAYLRELRLQRAHAALRAAEPGMDVTQIALAHGFGHLGHFGQDYRQRFGESPSQTLLRTRIR